MNDANNLQSLVEVTPESTASPSTHPYKSAFKKVSLMSLPIAINTLIVAATKFGEFAMLASLGKDELAASALIGTVSTFAVAASSSALDALNPLLGKAVKRNQKEIVGDIFRQSILFGCAYSALYTLILYFGEDILKGFQQPEAVAKIAGDYFKPYAFSFPASMVVNSLVQVLLATQKYRWLIPLGLTRSGIELALSYILIFGKGDLPKLGAQGLGIASLIQPYVTCIGLSMLMFFNDDLKKYQLFRFHFKETSQHFLRIAKLGLPVSLQVGGEIITRTGSALMAGHINKAALSAYQIGSQYSAFTTMILLAISRAVSVLTGNAVGDDNEKSQIRPLGVSAISLGVGIAALLSVLMIAAPEQLCGAFIDVSDAKNDKIISYSKSVLPIMGATQVFFASRDIATGALRGLEETASSMIISLGCVWTMGIGLAYVLTNQADEGIEAIVASMMLGVALGAAGVTWRWVVKSNDYINALSTQSLLSSLAIRSDIGFHADAGIGDYRAAVS